MPVLHVTDNGVSRPLDMAALRGVVQAACENLGKEVDAEPILTETIKNLYDGVPLSQVYDSAILASRTLIEKEPAYSQVTARILMHTIRREILGEEVLQGDMAARYIDYFPRFIKQGVEAELLDEQLLSYDLAKLAAALDAPVRSTQDLAEALDRNAHVWVSFKSLLSLDGCSLTGEVRDNVVRLADFVLGNTAKGAENLSDETIRTFINVNLQISEGLLEGDKAG